MKKTSLDTVNIVVDKTTRLSKEAIQRAHTPVPNRPVIDFTKTLNNHLSDVITEFRIKRSKRERELTPE